MNARVFAKRVHGVGDAATANLLFIHLVIGFACQGEPQQPQPFRGWSHLIARFEGRLGDGNEEKPVKAQFLHGRLRHKEMAQVHRVE